MGGEPTRCQAQRRDSRSSELRGHDNERDEWYMYITGGIKVIITLALTHRGISHLTPEVVLRHYHLPRI